MRFRKKECKEKIEEYIRHQLGEDRMGEQLTMGNY